MQREVGATFAFRQALIDLASVAELVAEEVPAPRSRWRVLAMQTILPGRRPAPSGAQAKAKAGAGQDAVDLSALRRSARAREVPEPPTA